MTITDTDSQVALEAAIVRNALVDRVARVMCELETNAMMLPTMGACFERISRTWPRHRDEARALIEALSKIGIVVEETKP